MADIKLTLTTIRDYSCKLSRLELIELLNKRPFHLAHTIPADAEITIETPGGGDMSHQTFDIDEVGGLSVCWQTKESS